MSFILSTVLMLFCGQLMAQDYIIDKDSVKHFGELKRRLPRVIKIHLTVEKSNKWFDATEIIGYYDSSNGLYHTAAKVQNEDYAVFLPFSELDSNIENSVEHSDGSYNWISYGKINYYEVIAYGIPMTANGMTTGRSTQKDIYLGNEKIGINRMPVGFLGERLETRKLLIKYFGDNTSIVTKINTDKIKNTADGIKELVQEYINDKLGKTDKVVIK
ncbi:hypothetical protein D3C80_486480 [compost metagenome]